MNKGLNIEGVCINNIDEYNKKCELIKQLAYSTYKNSKVSFIQVNKIELMYIVLDNIVKIAIMPEQNWIDIKNNIDIKLKQTLGNRLCKECKGQIKCLASCNNCHTNTCLECYINNFKKNKGIIKCKNCSYSFGCEVPDEYIDIAIDDIRDNAKKN